MTHVHTRSVDGESRPFHFDSTWRPDADIDRVWDILADIDSWPDWWPGVRSTHVLDQGTPEAEGRRAQVVVASPMGYTLRFTVTITEAVKPRAATITVSGDLRGVGTWRTLTDSDRADLGFMWCVVTRRRLVRLLRPAAPWAHGRVMQAGLRGLERHVT
ncbi:hypothetical protein EDL96_09500 [Kocuria soli]|uniref:Polyketide cyclase n=1 Tax=Kocuria soli TaxID=2485125 RepID=A0A3N4A2S8_9MICC|nr:hypothetical protein EDL96_09500 [Kocuria soli]